jgi:hypothetical protein
MDSLQQLPIDEKDNVTPQKQEVLEKYFPKREGYSKEPEKDKENEDGEKCEKSSLKYAIYAFVVALISFNPWLDLILLKLSFLSNTLTRFAIKIAFFMVMMLAAVYFL